MDVKYTFFNNISLTTSLLHYLSIKVLGIDKVLLKPPTGQPFVLPFFHANNKENTKASYHRTFVRRIHQVDSFPHKEPVMRKTFPCYDVIVKYVTPHDDVIKWKHFPRYWPFVRGIHRSPVNSPHKGRWRGALMFTLIYVWINGYVNSREAGDLRRYCAHYGVAVMERLSPRSSDDVTMTHCRGMQERFEGRNLEHNRDFPYTIDSRYIAVQYNMILHPAQRLRR